MTDDDNAFLCGLGFRNTETLRLRVCSHMPTRYMILEGRTGLLHIFFVRNTTMFLPDKFGVFVEGFGCSYFFITLQFICSRSQLQKFTSVGMLCLKNQEHNREIRECMLPLCNTHCCYDIGLVKCKYAFPAGNS